MWVYGDKDDRRGNNGRIIQEVNIENANKSGWGKLQHAARVFGKRLKWAINTVSRWGALGLLFELNNVRVRRRIRNRITNKNNDKSHLSLVSLKTLYPERCHGPLFGVEYYQLLSQSKIVFNIHSEKADGTVDNMKMFEATGVGACLLTDSGNNIKDLFEPDTEIVTYSSVSEAADKAKYLLDNETERIKIADAGQRRTLTDHTMLRRCEQINEIIISRL